MNRFFLFFTFCLLSSSSAVAAPATACTAPLYGGLQYDASSNSVFLCNPSGWGGVGNWSLAGTNIFPSTLTNSVGIGVAAPGASLEVSGSGAKFSGTIATETHADANVYIGVLGGTPRIIFGGATTHEIDNDGTGMRFYRPGNTDMYIDSGGNVGIGTTSPGTKLDVSGGVRAISASKGGACSPAGILGRDSTSHWPLFCNSAGVWASTSTSISCTVDDVNNGGGAPCHDLCSGTLSEAVLALGSCAGRYCRALGYSGGVIQEFDCGPRTASVLCIN